MTDALGAEPRRARVVMLVDNSIDGDSRVQKTAVSVAAAGYEVVLIGQSLGTQVEESTLGGARVIKLPDNRLLRRHRSLQQTPKARWRWPLAYRSPQQVRTMNALHQARRADYRDRVVGTKRELARGRQAARGRYRRPGGRRAAQARLQLDRVTWHGLRLLHRVRSRQFRQVQQNAQKNRGRLHRAWMKIVYRAMPRYFWRTRDGKLLDYELAYGPVIDELRPDLIHAHDYPMFGVAIRAAGRAHDRGRPVPVLNDVHEFMPGVMRNSLRWRLANIAYEREYLPRADAVVTVSEELADLLVKNHHLPERPTLVKNAPMRSWAEHPSEMPSEQWPSLRARCGLAEDVPLLVYSGAMAERRGIRTAVAGMPKLPGVHLALVCNRRDDFPDRMAELAADLGTGDRLHLVDYVRPEQVVPFLSSATIGLVPILHAFNHEISLITKYYEYMYARLPIVVSDVRTMAAFTRDLGNGEVFTAGDVDSYVTAVQTVLANRDRYEKVYDAQPELFEEHCWERQMDGLTTVYDRLLDR